MIFRSCVWFSPPQPPIRIDKTDRVRIKFRLIDGKIGLKKIIVLILQKLKCKLLMIKEVKKRKNKKCALEAHFYILFIDFKYYFKN